MKNNIFPPVWSRTSRCSWKVVLTKRMAAGSSKETVVPARGVPMEMPNIALDRQTIVTSEEALF